MKSLLFGLVIALAAAGVGRAEDVRLSSQLTEVLKLSQAQVSPAVIKSYIDSAPVAYSLSSDQILYLRGKGVSDDVIAEMLKHGTELRREAQAAAAAVAPPEGTPGVPLPSSPAPYVGNSPDLSGYGATPPVQDVAPYPYYDDSYYGDSGYYWGPGYWGWSGLGYAWIGPGWRWGGYGFRGGVGGFRGGVGGFRGGFGGFRGGVGGFRGGVGGFHGGIAAGHAIGGFHGGGGGFHGGGGGFHGGGGGHGGGGHGR